MSRIKLDIKEGEKKKNFRNRETNTTEIKKSIIDIKVQDKYNIHLYKGYKHPTKDFIVTYTYSDEQKTPRTPRHIHWVVDLLLKLKSNKKLTKDFIKELEKQRSLCQPVKNNKKDTLVTVIKNNIMKTDISKYEKLNDGKLYDIEFLFVLLSLLMVQEKTNYKNPKMLKKIFDALLLDDEEFNLYKIISAATYNGR